MKQMFRLMNECGRQLQQHVRSNLNKSLEVHDLFSRYGTDVISSCAFGIETNSMTNPNSDFRIYGKKIFESNFSRKISRTIFLTFPKFAYFFRVSHLTIHTILIFVNYYYYHHHQLILPLL